MIPYGKQDINQDGINAVIEVLKSDRITQCPAIEDFENMVAEYCGAKYAVAVNVCLPLYYGLKAEDQDYVVSTLKNILK